MKLLNLTAVDFTFNGLRTAVDNIKNQPFFIRLEDLQQELFQFEIKEKALTFYEIANQENRHTLELPVEDKERFFFRGVDLDGGERVMVFWYSAPHVGIETIKELRGAYVDLTTGKTKKVIIHVTDEAILSGFVVQDGEESVQLVQIPTWKGGENEAIIGRQPYELSELMGESGAKEGLFNNVWFYLLKDHEDYKASFNPETNCITLQGTCEAVEGALVSTDITLVGMEEVDWSATALIEAGIAPAVPKVVDLVDYEDGRAVGYLHEIFDGANYDTYLLRHPDGQVDRITFGKDAVFDEQILEALLHRYTVTQTRQAHPCNEKALTLLEQLLELQKERMVKVKTAETTDDIETDFESDIETDSGDVGEADTWN